MQRVVVLGGGISGYGSAVLAKKMGFDVFLSDMSPIAECYRKVLDEWEIPYEQGQHTMELILSATEVIKSPGIPEKAPVVKALREAGCPIISEIEFAGRYIDRSHVITITGSNGKTTTTSLIYKIMCDAQLSVALGGNIGESFAYSVATDPKEWYVLEISSFQLDGMYDFRADIALLMNITPDHLDRYDYKFENYVDSKMRTIRNQQSSDSFIYCSDDKTIMNRVEGAALAMEQLPFSAHDTIAEGAYLDGDKIIINYAGEQHILETSQMKLRGVHNYYNAMAATMAALKAGIPMESIRRSVYDFSPVEHRLEMVAQIDGVSYINDSKATNVDSVWYALDSMTCPTVWIAGGTDKGNDYSQLHTLAKEKVHTLICMGVDNKALESAFEGIIPTIVSTHSLAEAMQAAVQAAEAGDVVLLSPACASFDLFKSYIDRGNQFKKAILERA